MSEVLILKLTRVNHQMSLWHLSCVNRQLHNWVVNRLSKPGLPSAGDNDKNKRNTDRTPLLTLLEFQNAQSS